MTPQKKRALITAAIAVTACTVAILSGAINWLWQCAITGVVYFMSGYQVSAVGDRRSVWLTGLAVVAPFVLIYGGVTLFFRAWHVLPISVISVLGLAGGVRLGKYAQSRKPAAVIAIAALSVGLICTGGFIGMANWLHYTDASGEYRQAPDFELRTADNQVIRPEQLRGKVVVLDFWTTGCGYCFEQFPEFEAFYQRYKDHPDLAIYSVNIPLKPDAPGKAKALMNKFAYTFPTLYADSGPNEAFATFEISGVPTLILLDANGNICYKGGLYTAWYEFMYNLESQVSKLLRERKDSFSSVNKPHPLPVSAKVD